MDGPDEKPLLILNRQDKGRVALLLSDNTWLWARGYEGGGPHVDLLRRLAHWLMKEPDLEEEALRASSRDGRLTIEQQTMADTSLPATVRKPSGATETVNLTAAEPGLWRATVPPTRSGCGASSRATSAPSLMSARRTRANSPTRARRRTG
jgi:hypothetical protein